MTHTNINTYQISNLMHWLMREPVECYMHFKGEFKEPHTCGQYGKLNYIYKWCKTDLCIEQ